MKTLNLVYPDKSEIKYKISKFPDGQQQVTIGDIGNLLECHYDKGVYIKSRLNNFLDLELIICATKSLRSLGVKEIHLYVPYFVGARSDRQFEEGSNRYLADVICPIINSLNFESITVLDPHSYVLGNLLNGFKSISNVDLVKWATLDIGTKAFKLGRDPENYIFISPDAGALHKIYKVAQSMNFTDEIITCSKERDTEGKLTKVNVPVIFDKTNSPKDYIIIDDICDGGATFINISKELISKAKEYSFKPKIYLIVTHGIFSAGYKELGKYFDGIYCTNSYKEVPEFEWDGDKKDIPTKVKQLNVFI